MILDLELRNLVVEHSNTVACWLSRSGIPCDANNQPHSNMHCKCICPHFLQKIQIFQLRFYASLYMSRDYDSLSEK